LFYNPKRQNIDYLLRDALEDTIEIINLLESLHEDKSKDKLILYQVAILELNSSVKLFIKDIK
jgi:hypothetical protein